MKEDQKPPMPAMLGHSRWGSVSKSVLDTLNKDYLTTYKKLNMYFGWNTSEHLMSMGGIQL